MNAPALKAEQLVVPEMRATMLPISMGAREQLQVTDSASLGRVLRAMADRPPTRARLRLLVGLIGEAPAIVLAGHDGATLRMQERDDGPVPSDLEGTWPDLATQLAQLRAGLPRPGS